MRSWLEGLTYVMFGELPAVAVVECDKPLEPDHFQIVEGNE
jgi:hypothetical protein